MTHCYFECGVNRPMVAV